MAAIMKIFDFKQGFPKTKITILGIKFSYKTDYRKKVSVNYARKLTELQKEFGKRKIKVGFLVNEPAKWQYQSLYEEMETFTAFSFFFLIAKIAFDALEISMQCFTPRITFAQSSSSC